MYTRAPAYTSVHRGLQLCIICTHKCVTDHARAGFRGAQDLVNFDYSTPPGTPWLSNQHQRFQKSSVLVLGFGLFPMLFPLCTQKQCLH